MIREYRDRMRQRIDEARADIAEHLVQGSATDMAEYRERVGRAKGLSQARTLLDEVFKEVQSDDDE